MTNQPSEQLTPEEEAEGLYPLVHAPGTAHVDDDEAQPYLEDGPQDDEVGN